MPSATRLSLLSASSETEVLHSGASLQIQEGESLRLVCMADSNPPAMLRWEHSPPKPLQLSTPEELQLPRVELEDQGKYICQAQNSLGTQAASVNLSIRSELGNDGGRVVGEALPSQPGKSLLIPLLAFHSPGLLQLLGPSCSFKGQSLHCSCSSRAWPAPSLRWHLGEWVLEGNSNNASFTVTSSSTGQWTNSSLSLSMEFNTDRRLSCEAWSDSGVQRATILLVPDPEVSQGKVWRKECFLSRFYNDMGSEQNGASVCGFLSVSLVGGLGAGGCSHIQR